MFGILLSITPEQAMFNMQDLNAKRIRMLSTFVSFLSGKLTGITEFTADLPLHLLCSRGTTAILQEGTRISARHTLNDFLHSCK